MEVIPLTDNYSAIFTIELGGSIYEFTTSFNSRFKNWSFSLKNNNVEIISGVSMILGTDIIGQYNLGLGVLLMVDLSQTNIDAGAFDIGSRVVLVHTTEEEVADVFTV